MPLVAKLAGGKNISISIYPGVALASVIDGSGIGNGGFGFRRIAYCERGFDYTPPFADLDRHPVLRYSARDIALNGAVAMRALVNTDWLARHMDDPDLCLIEIDWDGLSDYEAGHIPGAIGWNWKASLWDPFQRDFPSDAEFAARLGAAGISASTTVVFYGAPVQFGTYTWWVFKLMGHADVRILDGGKVAWQNEGRPVTRELPVIRPASYVGADRQAALRAGRDQVMAAIGTPGTIILDHRSVEEYSGQRVGLPGKPDVGAERYGRIPGARHVPFDSLLNPDTTFRTADEIADLLAAHVPSRDHPVISYCRLAHRATLASFAMTELLAYTNVRVYDGSWTEWGSMVGMPIER